MYSGKTINLLQFIFNLGYKLKYFPFTLIKNKGIPKLQLVINRKKYIIWKILILGIALIQFIVLLFGLWYDISFNAPSEERAQFYLLVPYFMSGIIPPIFMVLKYENFIVLFNSFGVFGNKLRKLHNIVNLTKQIFCIVYNS